MSTTNHAPIHREPALYLVLMLALGIYLPRLTTLTIRGEESRRAVIAREMIERNDWIVPRTQGEVRLSRPPLQNWLIAGLSVAAGEMSAWSIRLPGLVTTLLTVALVYWSARRTCSVAGAVVAAAAYASFLQVLELGRTGETEPVFTLFVAASLLLWHGMWVQHPGCSEAAGVLPPKVVAAWAVGGACAGLAMLTKGLQAPLYFFGSVWMYLLLTRQFRALLRPGHFVGLIAFAMVVGLWQAPFMARMGLENGWLIYMRNVAHRFHDDRWSTYVIHFATYPAAVVCGCLAPWSVLLLAFGDAKLRATLGPRRDQAIFLATCILVCLPSVWLPPEARPRYFMPLFPCFAVLIGIAAELLWEQAIEQPRNLWTNFVRIAAVTLAVCAVACPLSSIFLPSSPFVMPLGQALVVALLLLGLAEIVRRLSSSTSPLARQQSALALAAGLGVIYVGPLMTSQQQRSENLPAAVAALQTKLPAEARLVSFDPVHHVFLHYLGRTVERLPRPQSAAEVPSDVDYFCVQVSGTNQPDLPFAWDEVASLAVDRNYHAVPKERVIVGRRRHVSAADVVQGTQPGRL
jgi:4-amino-4-deoxy-L-arabinose transferase-like glycosyltransferase